MSLPLRQDQIRAAQPGTPEWNHLPRAWKSHPLSHTSQRACQEADLTLELAVDRALDLGIRVTVTGSPGASIISLQRPPAE